jgi:Fungal protein kinase
MINTTRQLKKLSVWWRQVHVPMEVKPRDTEKDWLDACTQLCRYMRQVLGEQLDRRFVVGLVLCFDELTVLLSDRSGILGTLTPINIHKVRGHFQG